MNKSKHIEAMMKILSAPNCEIPLIPHGKIKLLLFKNLKFLKENITLNFTQKQNYFSQRWLKIFGLGCKVRNCSGSIEKIGSVAPIEMLPQLEIRISGSIAQTGCGSDCNCYL
jgi:hypothetical protein